MAVIAIHGDENNSGVDIATAKAIIDVQSIDATAIGAFVQPTFLSFSGDRGGIDLTIEGNGGSTGVQNPSGKYINARFQNYNFLALFSGGSNNLITLEGCFVANTQEAFRWLASSHYTTFKVAEIQGIGTGGVDPERTYENNTYHYHNGLIKLSSNFNQFKFDRHLVSGYDVEVPQAPTICYKTIFINCNFKMFNGGLGNDETVFTASATIEDLRMRAVVVFGGVVGDYFQDEVYLLADENDIFQNAAKGCLYLKNDPTNQALNISGTEFGYVGALPPSEPFIDIADYNNPINIGTDGVITPSSNWSANSDIIDIGAIKRLRWVDMISYMEATTGEQLNCDESLGIQIDAGLGVLTLGKTYTVFGADIVSDTITYTDTKCFIATSADFTTTSGAYVKEVLNIDNNDIRLLRSKVKLNISLWDSTLLTANTLKFFIEPHTTEYVKCNLDASGNPLYGNADENYNDATAFPCEFRYYQILAEGRVNLRAQQ